MRHLSTFRLLAASVCASLTLSCDCTVHCSAGDRLIVITPREVSPNLNPERRRFDEPVFTEAIEHIRQAVQSQKVRVSEHRRWNSHESTTETKHNNVAKWKKKNTFVWMILQSDIDDHEECKKCQLLMHHVKTTCKIKSSSTIQSHYGTCMNTFYIMRK